MSEANNGSAMLAGNPAGDQAAGNGGAAAAGASSNPPGMTSAGDANTPSANGNWYDNISDPDLKGYVQNKAWKDPGELANGYRSLEKLLGGEKIPMPKGAEDQEGWARVYDSLGRPATAEDYKLPVPEGMPTDFSKEAAGKFHELGLSAKQGEELANWFNGSQQGLIEQMNQQAAQKAEADIGALKQEWGGAYDENLELGRRAAREFGMNQENLSKLEQGLGTKGMLEFMSKIGRGLTEHNFEGGKSTNSFGMTPEAARSRVADLQADKTWSSKYLSGDADAKAEMARLMTLAYPDG